MENKKYIQEPYDTKTAVILINFGGPRNPDEVKPFLYNLFSDPVILNYPFISPNSWFSGYLYNLFTLYKRPLAWLVANLRQFSSKKMYEAINGTSPLIAMTYKQANNLQDMFLNSKLKIDIFVAFRYSHPFMPDVLDEIYAKGYTKLIVLPLFPQYSYTTTGSVQLGIKKWLKKSHLKTFFVSHWYEDEDYIQSFVNLIETELKNVDKTDKKSTEIIFSAHSIPAINIKNGDPYEYQIQQTAKAIIQKLAWKQKWHISYQSKLGPIKWLEPSTDKVIKEIAARNRNANILVVPLSFVSEHVETIYEIGMLYQEIANKAGIKRFVRVPALNENKYLIQALYNTIVNCLDSNEINIKEILITSP